MIMTKVREEWGELPQEPDICADFARGSGWGHFARGSGRGTFRWTGSGGGHVGWAGHEWPAWCQPIVTAMMPATIAAAPVSRRARPPSPSSLRPSTTPNRTLTSRAGATAATEVKVIATSTRT